MVILRERLRLRKKEEYSINHPLLWKEDNGRRHRNSWLLATKALFRIVLMLMGLLFVIAIALQQNFFLQDIPKEQNAKTSTIKKAIAKDRRTVPIHDGLFAIHLEDWQMASSRKSPSSDTKTGNNSASQHDVRQLMAGIPHIMTFHNCPHIHGTTCPDSSYLPLHIQVLFPGQDLRAVRWHAVDGTRVCGGGHAWKAVLETPKHAVGMAEIQLQWYGSSCLHGHYVKPWNASIPFNLVPMTYAPPQATSEIVAFSTMQSHLFVSDASWKKASFLQPTLLETTAIPTNSLPPYLWVPKNTQDTSTRLTTKDAVVFPKAIIKAEQEYDKFVKLSNYELLCFVGNRTMRDIHQAFLQIRPQIFNGQRPFKFHFYDIVDLMQPDRYWDIDTKKRIRKCKHLLVLYEEFDEPISQRSYEKQIINFVGHLLQLMNDETFPIRVFTWIESAIKTKQCHSPYLPWSNDHPCNDVLHKLFNPSKPVFPSRVKLLDNTDLTLPNFGTVQDRAAERPYILAAIALRIFVLVGEQVAHWRQAGQHGAIDGLHRNGIVEPNFELVPYAHWGEPISID